jgi:hypothetical protein
MSPFFVDDDYYSTGSQTVQLKKCGMRAGLSPDRSGDKLEAVTAALTTLAKAYRPKELAHAAYPLYERFRAAIPAGKAGRGAKGDLHLALIKRLAKRNGLSL